MKSPKNEVRLAYSTVYLSGGDGGGGGDIGRAKSLKIKILYITMSL